MSTIIPDLDIRKLPPSEAYKVRFAAPGPSQVSRFATLSWWDQGPVTRDGKHCALFWEELEIWNPNNRRLRAHPPRNSMAYCYLANQVDFYAPKVLKRPVWSGGVKTRVVLDLSRKLGTAQHYGFQGMTQHLLARADDGHWWSVAGAFIKWSRGRWWCVHRAYDNSRHAHMMNAGWEAYKR